MIMFVKPCVCGCGKLEPYYPVDYDYSEWMGSGNSGSLCRKEDVDLSNLDEFDAYLDRSMKEYGHIWRSLAQR